MSSGVISEMEREKAKNQVREKEITALQTRIDREKEYFAKKLNNLEKEIQSNKEIYEQQLTSERKTHAIENDTKRFEIDGLKRQLSLQNSETQGSRLEWEELKRQLARKDAELSQMNAEVKELEDKRRLERDILKTDLQCAKIEHQLAVHRGRGTVNFGKEQSDKIRELAQMLQKLKKESDTMKAELKGKV